MRCRCPEDPIQVLGLDHLRQIVRNEGTLEEKETGCFQFNHDDRILCKLEGTLHFGRDLFPSSGCPLIMATIFFRFYDGSLISCEFQDFGVSIGTAVHLLTWNYVELEDAPTGSTAWPISPYLEILSTQMKNDVKDVPCSCRDMDSHVGLKKEWNIDVFGKILAKSPLYHPTHEKPSFFIDLTMQANSTEGDLIPIIIIGWHAITHYPEWKEQNLVFLRNVKRSRLIISKDRAINQPVLIFDDQSSISKPYVFMENEMISDSPSLTFSFVTKIMSYNVDPFFLNVSPLPSAMTMNYEGFITDYLYIDDPIECTRLHIGYILDNQYRWYVYHSVLFYSGKGWRIGAKVRLWNVHPLSKDGEIVGWANCVRSSATIVAFAKGPSRFSSPSSIASLFIGILSKISIYDASRIYTLAAFLLYQMNQRNESKNAMSEALQTLISFLGFSRSKRDLTLEYFEHMNHCVHTRWSHQEDQPSGEVRLLSEWTDLFKKESVMERDLFSKWKSCEFLMKTDDKVAFVYIEYKDDGVYCARDSSAHMILHLCSGTSNERIANGWYLIRKCLFLESFYFRGKSEVEIIVNSDQLLLLFTSGSPPVKNTLGRDFQNLEELFDSNPISLIGNSEYNIIAKITSRRQFSNDEQNGPSNTVVMQLSDVNRKEISINLFLDVEQFDSVAYCIPGSIVALHRVLLKRTRKGVCIFCWRFHSKLSLLKTLDPPSLGNICEQTATTVLASDQPIPFTYIYHLNQEPNSTALYRLVLKVVDIQEASFSLVCSICKGDFVHGQCFRGCRHPDTGSPYIISANLQCLVSDYSSEAVLCISNDLVPQFLRCTQIEKDLLCQLAMTYGPLHYGADMIEFHKGNPYDPEEDESDSLDTEISLPLPRSLVTSLNNDQMPRRQLIPDRPESFAQFLCLTQLRFPIPTICTISKSATINTTPTTPSTLDILKNYSTQLLSNPAMDISTIQAHLSSLGYERLRLRKLANCSIWTINPRKLFLQLVCMDRQDVTEFSKLINNIDPGPEEKNPSL